MTFTHLGLFFAFVPIIAAPIVLHLLTLHKLQTIELSTYRFLFAGDVRSRRRFQFEDLLLALLRTLFLLLIVMALARPTVSKWGALLGGMASGRDIVVLIDASASMSLTTDGRSAMQLAKQAAGTLVENLPQQDRVTVIRVGKRPREICSRFASNPDAIRKSIEQLEAGAARANWFAALSHSFQSDQLKNPQVYVISDLQASGWQELKTGDVTGVMPADAELIVINVGSHQPLKNHGLVAGEPDDRDVLTGLPVTLRPRVFNHSAAGAQIPVSLFSGDEELVRKTVSVEPGESAVAELVYTPDQAGVQRLRYEIPDDQFAADNIFRFTLSAATDVNVLLVNGQPSSDPLEDRGLFLRAALTVEEDQQQALQVREIRQRQLTASQLDQADVAILADCGDLSAADHGALRQFVQAGGGLLILPGEHVDQRQYNRTLLAPASSDGNELIGVQLRDVAGTTATSRRHQTEFDRVGGVDFAHPVFSVFRDPDAHYLAETRVYRRFRLAESAGVGTTWTLARLTDGSPFIATSRYGQGRVLLSAIPFDTSWSNLPLQPEFVPLVLRMVAHVKRRADVNVAAIVPAEGLAEISVDPSWETVEGAVVDETHAATPLEFELDTDRLVAAFDKTFQAGFYDVSVSGGPIWDRREQTVAFAINTSAAESQFDKLAHRDLSSLLPDARITLIDASPDAQQQHGQVGSKRELWRTLIWLAVIVVSIELLLATPGGSPTGWLAASRSRVSQYFAGQSATQALSNRRTGHVPFSRP